MVYFQELKNVFPLSNYSEPNASVSRVDLYVSNFPPQSIQATVIQSQTILIPQDLLEITTRMPQTPNCAVA